MKKLLSFLVLLLWLSPFAKAATQYSGVININTATVEQLVLLPGIGPKKAQAIFDLKAKKPFVKIEELLLVEGIGETLFNAIKSYVVLEGATNFKKLPATPTNP